jgi:tetratricopeptide (TPR) repeat protein
MEAVYPYEYNGKEIRIALRGHNKTEVIYNIKKFSISVGFKGESKVLEGNLFDQIIPTESYWAVQDNYLVIYLQKKKKTQWPLIIRPVQGDNTVDAHSLFLWGYYLSTKGEEFAAEGEYYIEMAAERGHRDAIITVCSKLIQEKNYDRARAFLEPGKDLYKETIFDVLLGDIATGEENFDEATELFERAAEKNSEAGIMRLASLYFYREKNEKGIDLLKKYAPKSAIASLELATKLNEMKEFAAANAYYQLSKTLNPDIVKIAPKELVELESNIEDILEGGGIGGSKWFYPMLILTITVIYAIIYLILINTGYQ